MYPLILTVLNRDSRTPDDCQYRGVYGRRVQGLGV